MLSCHSLSVCRYVKRIEIYFLPVGHTHGQIDQLFSRLSVFLKRLPAKTLPELCWSLQQAFFNTKKHNLTCNYVKKKPISVVIDSVTDVNLWLQGLLDKTQQKNWNLNASLAYQFCLNDSGNGVLLKSKLLAVNSDWQVCVLFYNHLSSLRERRFLSGLSLVGSQQPPCVCLFVL